VIASAEVFLLAIQKDRFTSSLTATVAPEYEAR
jgi:hypothetical protein